MAQPYPAASLPVGLAKRIYQIFPASTRPAHVDRLRRQVGILAQGPTTCFHPPLSIHGLDAGDVSFPCVVFPMRIMKSLGYPPPSACSRVWLRSAISGFCTALGELFDRGLSHGDLTLANLVRTDSGGSILGLGLPAASGYRIPEDHRSACEIAQTLAFSAPEQLLEREAEPTARSDVYSFALILLRLLQGIDGFHPRAPSHVELECLSHAAVHRTRVGVIPDNLPGCSPPELRDLLASVLVPDPRDRPAPRAVLESIEVYVAEPHSCG